MTSRLEGLIAATCTPFRSDGSLNLDQVPHLIDQLERSGVGGIYIGGSTGEGMSLTAEERRRTTEAFITAARGRLRTIVHVGHNSLAEARQLATHAEAIGADVVSATAPSYYKVETVSALVDSMAQVASGAPRLPFYYYHIPKLTGAAIDMVEFLQRSKNQIENLAGIKYTAPTVNEFQMCLQLDDGHFDVVWGCDEMLLSALAVGARAAIGSTYNFAAPLYCEMIEAFNRHDLPRAQQLQGEAARMIRLLQRYPFLAAVKFLVNAAGVPCGPCRRPVDSLTPEQAERLWNELRAAQLLPALTDATPRPAVEARRTPGTAPHQAAAIAAAKTAAG